MANIKSAKKRARQAEGRRQHNASRRSMLRSYMKKVTYAIEAGNKEEAQSAYDRAVSVLDKAANKGLIHLNKAARTKSRLNSRIQAL